MISMSDQMHVPWMVAGDFNVISSLEEQAGGAFPNAHNLEEFSDAIHQSGFSDVKFDGSPFTWTNGTVCSVWTELW
mgnify:CR=1 FL=1